MIERLELTNFQAHADRVVELDTITTIVGDSDRGKSAILRALVWVLTNKPSGDSFVQRGKDTASVVVHVDGHTITRTKGKAGNEYTLDGEEFKAFGNNVPEPVAQVARVPQEAVARQMDPPFWVGLSGGHLADALNGTTGIELATTISKRNTAEEKEAVRDAKAARQAVDDLQGKIDALDGVREIADALDDLAEAEKALDGEAWLIRKAADAVNFVEHVTRYNAKADKLADTLEGIRDQAEELAKLTSVVETYLQVKTSRKQLASDITELTHKLDQVPTCQTCNQPL